MAASGLSPKSEMRACAIAPLISLWPEGDSGYAGVARNGTQLGSAVMRYPSALRMALIGRQKLYAYFESQQAIAASPAAMFRRANTRPLCETDNPVALAAWLAMGLHGIA